MGPLKQVLDKLLDPSTVFTCIFPPCVFALLIAVFCLGLEQTPLAYAVVFPLSAYALVLWVVKAPVLARRTKNAAKNSAPVHWFSSTPLGARLIGDERFRVRLGAIGSIAISIPYAAFCLYLGASTLSYWFITLGAYYLVLCALRIRLIIDLGRKGQQRSREISCYRFTARLLLGLLPPFAGMVVLMAVTGSGFAYPGYAVYAMAIYTFATAIVAVVNVLRARKSDSAAIAAARTLNFVTAAVSVLGLQSAMLASFSTEGAGFTMMMNAITGGIVLAVVAGVTIGMNIRGGKLKARVGDAE